MLGRMYDTWRQLRYMVTYGRLQHDLDHVVHNRTPNCFSPTFNNCLLSYSISFMHVVGSW